MKTFLYKAFIILVSIVIIDVVVGYVSRYTLAQLPPSNANVPHTVNSLMKEKTDILILGASKAKHGIDPKMLNKHFQMDCYNAGEDGMDMFFYNLILQGMLSRSTPKMVIVDMAPLSLNNTPSVPKYLYGLSLTVDKYAQQINTWQENLKLKSNLYRYNNFFPLLISTLRGQNSGKDGYTPLDGEYTRAVLVPSDKLDVNTIELQSLDELVRTCKTKHIELYMYISPCHYHNNKLFNAYLKKYCTENDVHFRDMSEDENYLTTNYYKDRDHLNRIGAERFTQDIIRDIKACRQN